MLLNMTLSKEGQETLKNDLLNAVNAQNITPLRRYAMLNTLYKAAKESADVSTDAGIQFALTDERTRAAANAGKQFQLDGLTYQLQFNNKYNYEAHDEDGSYKQCLKRIADLETLKKAETIHRKALEAKILAAHPLLQPTTDSTVTLKYIAV